MDHNDLTTSIWATYWSQRVNHTYRASWQKALESVCSGSLHLKNIWWLPISSATYPNFKWVINLAWDLAAGWLGHYKARYGVGGAQEAFFDSKPPSVLRYAFKARGLPPCWNSNWTATIHRSSTIWWPDCDSEVQSPRRSDSRHLSRRASRIRPFHGNVYDFAASTIYFNKRWTSLLILKETSNTIGEPDDICTCCTVNCLVLRL